MRIRSIAGGELTGSVEPEITAGEVPPEEAGLPPIILFQALPKGEKMDLIVRQAAEGGLSEIVPFIAEHSIPKLDTRGRRGSGAGAEKKQARWERIVKEARQQSGSPIATKVSSVLSMDGLLARWETLRQNLPWACCFTTYPLRRPASTVILIVIPRQWRWPSDLRGDFPPPRRTVFWPPVFRP